MSDVEKLKVGEKLPFFSLKDDQERIFTSDQLYGKPAVIYFYPKDDTEGCTAEACSFRDALERFNDLRVTLFGVSPDPVSSHTAFKKKYGLNFPLLADEKHEMAEAFHVWKEKSMYGRKYFGVVRSTFLIDAQGTIRWIEQPVKVEGHVERVLTALRDYTGFSPES